MSMQDVDEASRTFGSTVASVVGSHVTIRTPFDGDELEWARAVEWAGVAGLEVDLEAGYDFFEDTDEEVYYFELEPSE